MRTRTNCALVASPIVRRHATANTDAIAPNFPAGISRPALRALLSAGLTELRGGNARHGSQSDWPVARCDALGGHAIQTMSSSARPMANRVS
jgi:hypothetical protein